MRFFNILATLSAIATTVSAVNIRNYKDAGCRGGYFQCSNIDYQRCCSLPSGGPYGSTYFLGLPAPTGLGVICARKNDLNCDTIKKGGLGTNVCLGNPDSRGSFWYHCPGCRKRDDWRTLGMNVTIDDTVSSTSAVQADIMAFEDHQFRIDDTTPEDAVAALISYFEADAGYADIPKELKQYEVAEGDQEE